jgi:hypothetical protein
MAGIRRRLARMPFAIHPHTLRHGCDYEASNKAHGPRSAALQRSGLAVIAAERIICRGLSTYEKPTSFRSPSG